ncbi:MAG: ATPase [Rhodospirillales bacterium]|nr:MAG: ATPase [Rhodospirillales bacterium]
MSSPRKRFYKQAAAGHAGGGFAVLLDGRAVRTPKGHPLILPSQALAEAAAREWDDQGETIDPATMPLMQLAATALDRVGGERGAMSEALLRYAETDLLCYRATHPADLVARQSQAWQPVLDWAALHLDAALLVTPGLAPIAQPREALSALARTLERLDDWRFTALSVVTAATGSLMLGLALLEGFLDSDKVIAASQLDEAYQSERWGEDEEGAARLKALAEDIRAAENFLDLL